MPWKKIRLISGFGWAIKLLSHFTGYVNKAFGNFVYDENLGNYRDDYRLYNLIDSIREMET